MYVFTMLRSVFTDVRFDPGVLSARWWNLAAQRGLSLAGEFLVDSRAGFLQRVPSAFQGSWR